MGHDHTHATVGTAPTRSKAVTDPPAPVAPVPLPARPAPVIRRAFDLAKMKPLLSGKAAAPVTKEDKSRIYLRRAGDGWEQSEDDGYSWAPITEEDVTALATSAATWSGKVVVLDLTLGPDVVSTSLPAGKGGLAVNKKDAKFDVTEVPRDLVGEETEKAALGFGNAGKPHEGPTPGDRHAVVHHTAGKKGEDPHLTVENAHVELMLLLQKSGTTAGFDKNVAQKPGVNTALQKRDLNEIDNLNFFPAPAKPKGGPKPKGKEADSGVSLQDYLALIGKALGALPDVPPAYAARILTAAGSLATHTGLDLGQVFLREGAGDERHLIRALMIMHDTGLVTGLVLPAPVLKVFARYGTKGAELPLTEPVGDKTEWVKKGAQSSGKATWTDLEGKYVKAYFPDFAKAVKAYAKPG